MISIERSVRAAAIALLLGAGTFAIVPPAAAESTKLLKSKTLMQEPPRPDFGEGRS